MYATYKRPSLDNRKTYRLEVRRWKKVFHENENQKKTGLVILTFNKIYLEIKTVMRDKEGNCIMIKGSTQEDDITIVNKYAHSISIFKADTNSHKRTNQQ